MEDGRKHIIVTKRTRAEIESYQEGFNAGVEMCIDTIIDNYKKYKKIVRSVVMDITESEGRQ